ncbi:tRNA threonylcarbamoyladenosine dehydratase [Limnohabitans radicicola]|uniref:tRNA threonylcarbamoyladenosine dehydratase n=1 Tax=Limnohabitans radicicola TaxID=2771427 RepID=A0A927IMN4_9BURK|nr:tRNA threonylcarbamoyladenosine dehydratase [Limnohabitans radicicola]MBD8051187.1 tRNA threonylcarbamoyladenosine dehydratase [Limnohabitans radicicola]
MTDPAWVEQEDRRFGGLQRLYGVHGAAQIRAAHVVVVGIGGVGSWTAEALARSGVARLTLIDMDHIAESNVNRQIHALTSTLGRAKALAMQERIAEIHPTCQVDVVDDFVGPDNWPALLPAEPDALIDACDDAKAKLALAVWARQTRTPFVCVGAAGGKRLAHKVDVDDLALATHDPLLARLRYQLRKHHGAPKEGKRMGVCCVFSREAVAPPDASCAIEGDGSLNCHGYGSSVGVTATFGLCAASEILNFLASGSSKAKK